MGPLRPPGNGTGSLPAEVRAEIKEKTKVNASVPYRPSRGGRRLTLAGEADELKEAKRMSMRVIERRSRSRRRPSSSNRGRSHGTGASS